MRIIIETVDHKDQRYDTVGDWQTGNPIKQAFKHGPDDDILFIRVSRMADWRSEALVAVHELVEALLCRQAGITAEVVDAWDMGPGKGPDEPGDDPRAPYHELHKTALALERQLCWELGLKWSGHEVNIREAGK
jgi:hypothetical protein